MGVMEDIAQQMGVMRNNSFINEMESIKPRFYDAMNRQLDNRVKGLLGGLTRGKPLVYGYTVTGGPPPEKFDTGVEGEDKGQGFQEFQTMEAARQQKSDAADKKMLEGMQRKQRVMGQMPQQVKTQQDPYKKEAEQFLRALEGGD